MVEDHHYLCSVLVQGRVYFRQEPADSWFDAHQERIVIMVLPDTGHRWKNSVGKSPASP